MTVSENSVRKAEGKIVRRGYFERKDRSLLVLRGADSRDFVQRMSTNDLSPLDRGPIQTVFTTEKGKIVDVVTVLNLGGDSVLLIGISRDEEGTKAWLEQFIIMDDVSIKSASGDYRHILLFDANFPQQPSGSFQFRDEWGHHLVIASGFAGAYLGELQSAGYEPLGFGSLEGFRIEQGIPDWPSELSGEYNPLEARLNDTVSWTKGCYVGQEVIARLDTYKKLQRVLVKLVGDGNSKPQLNLYLGKDLVGMITSVSVEHEGEYHALGYVKPAVAETKTTLEAGVPGSGIKVFIKG
jgi:folate-binding protein YgfZ